MDNLEMEIFGDMPYIHEDLKTPEQKELERVEKELRGESYPEKFNALLTRVQNLVSKITKNELH